MKTRTVGNKAKTTKKMKTPFSFMNDMIELFFNMVEATNLKKCFSSVPIFDNRVEHLCEKSIPKERSYRQLGQWKQVLRSILIR